jgi:hypothetical protein
MSKRIRDLWLRGKLSQYAADEYRKMLEETELDPQAHREKPVETGDSIGNIDS